MNRDTAYALVTEFVKNENLIKHMLAVEAAMPGLLHDFDWEIHPTLDEHPQKGAPLLRERGVPEDIIRCIQSHAEHTGVPREKPMDRALFAVDELTGLVTATVATTGVPETEETVISTATGSRHGGVTHGSSVQPIHASPASKRYRIPTEP